MTQRKVQRAVVASLVASVAMVILSAAWNLRRFPLSVLLITAAVATGAMAVTWSLRATLLRTLGSAVVAFVASRFVQGNNEFGVATEWLVFASVTVSVIAALVFAIGSVRWLIGLGSKLEWGLTALGVVMTPFVLLVASSIYSPYTAWFFMLPIARLSVGGERNSGYVHYLTDDGTDALVTIRTLGSSETYWVVMRDGREPGVRRCRDWKAPQFPFVAIGDVNPPCFVIDEGAPEKSPSRDVLVGDDFVEFTGDDGKRLRAKW